MILVIVGADWQLLSRLVIIWVIIRLYYIKKVNLNG